MSKLENFRSKNIVVDIVDIVVGSKQPYSLVA